MLEEFENIVGSDVYGAFLKMLKAIGPHARTHRISVVIAGMLKYAVHQLPDHPEEGSLGEALWAVEEGGCTAYDPSPESEKLRELIDRLCREAGMVNERTNSRGNPYSIADNSIAEFAGWYSMPWEPY